jgi:hypothetical protein
VLMKSRNNCGCAARKDLRTSDGDSFSSQPPKEECRRMRAIALPRTTSAAAVESQCAGVGRAFGVEDVAGACGPANVPLLLRRVLERCRRARLGPSSWKRKVRR